MASGAWPKPPPQGQLSQGPKPLALSQLPTATPPSAEGQGRTFTDSLALPLPDLVPWKQPDLAMVRARAFPAWAHFDVGFPFSGGGSGPGRFSRPAAGAVNSSKHLYPGPSSTPQPTDRGVQAQTQTSNRMRPNDRHCGTGPGENGKQPLI